MDPGCYGYKTGVSDMVLGMEKSIAKQRFGCPKHRTGILALAHLGGGSGVFASEHFSFVHCHPSPGGGRRWTVGSGEERQERLCFVYLDYLIDVFPGTPEAPDSSLG